MIKNVNYFYLIILGVVINCSFIYAQVGIGTVTPDASSILDLNATTKGMLAPRMTSAQKAAIVSPANGLLVYQTNGASGFWYYDGSVWQPFLFGNDGWRITGNSGTVDGTSFLGTIDNIPLTIRVNNQKGGRIDHLLMNTFLGYQSGNANTTGTANSFFGYQSGLNNTTGIKNTAIGDLSLPGNTTGSNNTAVGYSTLNSITAGGSNSVFGYQVMSASTSGSNNVGIGEMALYNNNANNNVAIGYNAGLSNLAGTANSFLGYQSGYSNTNTSNNLFVGYKAGYNNTVNNSHFLGYQSGYSNTTGSDNLFVGYNSGYSNTTGYDNTFLGKNAGRSNVIGYQNTYIGKESGYSSTGNWNTGVGYLTLFNSTGSSNTALGNTALYSNTTGIGNSAVGSYTLYLNTTGNGVSAFGSWALQNSNADANSVFGCDAMSFNTSGAGNTAVGYRCLKSNTTANNNSGLGYAALYDNTTGTYNTAIGYNAGNINTTGSYNTFVGNDANCIGTGLTKAVAIGYNAKVSASSSMILGGTGVDTVRVGIGTTAPSATLHVVGNQIATGSLTIGTTTLPSSSFRMQIVNPGNNTNGLLIKAGELNGDVALRLTDQDASFNIMDIEADQGYVVLGTTYAAALAANGIVYGVDQQNDNSVAGDADFNTKNGVYRQNGVAISPYTIGGGIVNSEVSATASTSTTSASYVLMSGMTATPAAGTYKISFSATGYGSANNLSLSIALYKAGSLITSTQRMQDAYATNRRFLLQTQGLITVNGSEAIETRYSTSSGTFTVLERSMILVKVSN